MTPARDSKTRQRFVCWWRPGAFLKAWCRLSGMCISHKRYKERRFLKYLIETIMVKCNLPGVSSLKRGIWCRNSKWLGQKFSKKAFLDTLSKTWQPKSPGFTQFSFVPEKPHVDPRNIVFGMGWTEVAGSTWDFFGTKHYSHKAFESSATLLEWASKKHCFKIFITTQETIVAPPVALDEKQYRRLPIILPSSSKSQVFCKFLCGVG